MRSEDSVIRGISEGLTMMSDGIYECLTGAVGGWNGLRRKAWLQNNTIFVLGYKRKEQLRNTNTIILCNHKDSIVQTEL